MRRLSFALMISLSLTGVFPAPAGADQATCATAGHYYLGYNQGDLRNYVGNAAQVTARSAAHCDTDGSCLSNGSLTGPLIASRNLQGWVQGELKSCPNGQIWTFAQSRKDANSAPTNVWGSAISAGGNYTLTNQWCAGCNSGAGAIQVYIGGAHFHTPTWSPTGNWTTPYQPQWFSETKYTETDPQGLSTSKVRFTNLQQQYTAPGSGVFTWETPSTMVFLVSGPVHPLGSLSGVLNSTFYTYCNEVTYPPPAGCQ